jgi:hypothetical protein
MLGKHTALVIRISQLPEVADAATGYNLYAKSNRRH